VAAVAVVDVDVVELVLVVGVAVCELLVLVVVPDATVTVVVELPQPASARTTAAAARRALILMRWCSARTCSDPSHSPSACHYHGSKMTEHRATPALEDEQRQLVGRVERLSRALERLDPFWAPQLVVASAILLDVSLPDKLTLGPSWLLPSFEGVLLIGLVIASPHPRMRHSPTRRYVAMALIGLVSIFNIISLYLLCHFLLHHGTSSHEGRPLILAGIVLWVTNVLLFGLWYWELDRGGPLARSTIPDAAPDFLFPQMTETRHAPKDWMPGLIDYLYVSFTNATAFSPTDTMPLTASAKLLMSAQALTALLTIGLVVARAVNILQ